MLRYLIIFAFVTPLLRSQLLNCHVNPCRNGGVCTGDEHHSVCLCPSGYTGPSCEFHDPCLNNPCHPHAQCVSNNADQYRCICPLGWTGRNCDEDVDECSAQPPCEHDGQCVNTLGSYLCKCQPGYTGTRCEVEIDECLSQPCMNGGLCVDKIGSYGCVCPNGFEGERCQHELNECAGTPCANGAQCEDLIGTYRCHCLPGWSGPQCTEPITNCTGQPCLNNGICEEFYSSERSAEARFHCQCQKGFMGTYCEISDTKCYKGFCANHGLCIEHSSGRRCLCPSGYFGLSCEKMLPILDESFTSKSPEVGETEGQNCSCMNGAQCVNGSCQCLPGFSGVHCEREDPCSKEPCKYGLCLSNHTSVDGYTCVCEPGFQGNHCEFNTFDCYNQPCGDYGTCIDQINGYFCECLDGVTGRQCLGRAAQHAVTNTSIHAAIPNHKTSFECPEGTCENSAKCSVSGNGSEQSFTCHCETAVGFFTGERCELDLNECLRPESPCLNGAECINTHGSYYCLCPTGFHGPRCEWLVDPCRVTNRSVCRNGGQCRSHNHGIQCACPTGFGGPFCEIPLDHCSKRPCQNGALCLNLLESHVCLCRPGYFGANCEHERCSDSPQCQLEMCQNNGTLMRTANHTYCKCRQGFLGSQCEGKLNFCNLVSETVTFDASKLLTTLEPFSIDPEWIDELRSNHIMLRAIGGALIRGEGLGESVITTGQCHPDGTDRCVPAMGNATRCDCKPGFTGELCEKRLDYCELARPADNENYCLNGGICESKMIPNYVDGFVQYTETAVCQCPPGYSGNRCQNFTGYCLPNHCQHNGVCTPSSSTERVPKGAPYQCHCSRGRAGVHCEMDLSNPCETVLNCQHGSTCQFSSSGEPVCICEPGYCGTKCEFKGKYCMATTPSTITLVPSSTIPPWKMERLRCDEANCEAKRGNGRCDCECDYLACEFDGFECLFALQSVNAEVDTRVGGVSPGTKNAEENELKLAKPWSGCTPIREDHVACHLKFGNGICDPACVAESCLFDGWDCEQNDAETVKNSTCQELCPGENCPNHCNQCPPSDSQCSQYTATPSSRIQEDPPALLGELVLLIDMPPAELFDNNSYSQALRNLLEGLSNLLRLKVQPIDFYTSVIPIHLNFLQPSPGFELPLRLSNSSKLRRVRRAALSTGTVGSQLHLKLDATSCFRTGRSCFKHVDTAAQFVAAALHQKKHSFLQPILSVQSTRIRPAGSKHQSPGLKWFQSPSWMTYLLLLVLVVLLLGLLIAMLFAASQYQQQQQQQQQQPGDCSSNYRRTLASYLQKIGQRSKTRKIQRAKTWYPANASDLHKRGLMKDTDHTARDRTSLSLIHHPSSYRQHVVTMKHGIYHESINGSSLLNYLTQPTEYTKQTVCAPEAMASSRTTTCDWGLDTTDNMLSHTMFPQSKTVYPCVTFPEQQRVSVYPSLSETSDGTGSTASTRTGPDCEASSETDDSTTRWYFQQIVNKLLSGNGIDMDHLNWTVTGRSPVVDGPVSFGQLLMHLSRLDHRDAVVLHQTEMQSGPVISPSRLHRFLDMRVDETGESLLHLAARLNQAGMVVTLLNAGADPTSVDNAGRTALLSAVSSSALESVHAILTHPATSSNPMCFVPSLLTDSTTPLIQAVKIGDTESFRLILHAMNVLLCALAKSNANGDQVAGTNPGLMNLLDLNIVDSLGRTVLHWAAVTDQAEFVHCLLEAGAACDAQTIHDETPLALAAKEGALSACRLLLSAGASHELADYLDRTPKMLAEQGGHQDVVMLLENFNQVATQQDPGYSSSMPPQKPITEKATPLSKNRDWRAYFTELELKNSSMDVAGSSFVSQKFGPGEETIQCSTENTGWTNNPPLNMYNGCDNYYPSAELTQNTFGHQMVPIKTEQNSFQTTYHYHGPVKIESHPPSHSFPKFTTYNKVKDDTKQPSASTPLVNSDSESPNRWSSSPSDTSPKYSQTNVLQVPNSSSFVIIKPSPAANSTFPIHHHHHHQPTHLMQT